jgi:hypothetical protein
MRPDPNIASPEASDGGPDAFSNEELALIDAIGQMDGGGMALLGRMIRQILRLEQEQGEEAALAAAELALDRLRGRLSN